MGRGSRNDPARRYADSVSTSQQHQPEMHDHMDQKIFYEASLLRQQQILKAQSLQSGSDMRCVSLKAFYVYPFCLVDVERDYLSLNKRYPRLCVRHECTKVVVHQPKQSFHLSLHTTLGTQVRRTREQR
ncbi:uncharacterized protein LOC109848437 isoform X3 [Asparagus officinalis]|uniref:uncharacterized protein LOC109848437 isoform X3 n=1 Tax=Asparagus officinalis TaxID=4686 RepID=UPI00098E384A|nr:uncharacterized protein LOC109848437 isoform X3 [Asparagus officinalis]